jgi:hypothetical protein
MPNADKYSPSDFRPKQSVGKKVLITVLEESPAVDTAKRLEALDEFFASIKNCDEEVPEFERVKFRERELDL